VPSVFCGCSGIYFDNPNASASSYFLGLRMLARPVVSSRTDAPIRIGDTFGIDNTSYQKALVKPHLKTAVARD